MLKVADGFCELLITFMASLKGLLPAGLVATLINAATIKPPPQPFSPFRFGNEVQPWPDPSNATDNLLRNHSQLVRNIFQQYGESPSFMEQYPKMKESLFMVILHFIKQCCPEINHNVQIYQQK